jgi:hypothetical protein
MLHQGYWLFEFISISSGINKARGQYERSILLSESDDNDLTYFLLAQVKVIQQAIGSLHTYLERKAHEMGTLQQRLPAAACAEPFGLPLCGALPPEQPWRQPSDRPQRSAEAGIPGAATSGQGWTPRNLSGAGGSAGAAGRPSSAPFLWGSIAE